MDPQFGHCGRHQSERIGVFVRQVDVGGISEAGSTKGERRV